MRNFTTKVFYLCVLIALSVCSLNAQVYLDPTADVEDRVEDLLSKMSLAEKIGQMTQAERARIDNKRNEISELYLGSILSGGGSTPASNDVKSWSDMYDAYQEHALQTPLKIPMIYGIDAVHGHNNLVGAVIFPHNIGLGCTRNPELVKETGRITALEVTATGIDWTFSPCVAVPRDDRWGRVYEGFSENDTLVVEMSEAIVLGYQSDVLGTENYVAACAKHFIADGGTTGGDDAGNAEISEDELRRIHLPGYITTIDAGVATVMPSQSRWNNEECHGIKYLLTDVLKTELGFEGFVISDWEGVGQVHTNYKTAVAQAINAGVDMAMEPDNYKTFISTLTECVNEGLVPTERIDDAVRRILKVKFEMGLFENPYTNRALADTVGCEKHREVARQAVRESLVLLKNDGSLPLLNDGSKILVAGSKANDIGVQCGGWTIQWQGALGNITEGTTILDAIKEKQGNGNVEFITSTANIPDADVAVVVIGEEPYAEWEGDASNLAIKSSEANLVNSIADKGIPVVVVLLSGRPMILDRILDKADAIVAAWLPGTEGKGITDVLYKDYDFTGKLSYSWPKSMSQIPINWGDEEYDPLYPYGYGLDYTTTSITPNDLELSSINIYPNPAENFLYIKGIETDATVQIIDITGSVVKNKQIKASSGIQNVEVSDLENGIYIVKLINKNQIVKTSKFVKK